MKKRSPYSPIVVFLEHMEISWNGGTPKSSIYSRMFHELNHPAIGVSPWLWKPPYVSPLDIAIELLPPAGLTQLVDSLVFPLSDCFWRSPPSKKKHEKQVIPKVIVNGTMWGPQDISWFINPATIVINTINHIVIGVMFTNLAIFLGVTLTSINRK